MNRRTRMAPRRTSVIRQGIGYEFRAHDEGGAKDRLSTPDQPKFDREVKEILSRCDVAMSPSIKPSRRSIVVIVT
jgi:hypothetical protein